jgi:hypothetical protein
MCSTAHVGDSDLSPLRPHPHTAGIFSAYHGADGIAGLQQFGDDDAACLSGCAVTMIFGLSIIVSFHWLTISSTGANPPYRATIRTKMRPHRRRGLERPWAEDVAANRMRRSA